MPWIAGQQLQNGKYVIEQVLGQGGFGITYKALHIELNQTVVIKTPLGCGAVAWAGAVGVGVSVGVAVAVAVAGDELQKSFSKFHTFLILASTSSLGLGLGWLGHRIFGTGL